MAAKIDIKKNSRIKLTAAGYRAERVAIVSGTTGTAAEVLFNAINDAALPNIGDAHPDISTITLNDIVCDPLGGNRYKVVMSYYKDSGTTTTSSAAEARLVSGLSVEETHTDIDGQTLDTSFFLVGGISIARQRFTAEVERPRMSIGFEYTATGFPTNDINKYLGKVNSTIWNGYPAGSILCSSIDVDQNGDNFRVSYNFTYRPEGWQFKGKAAYHPDDIASAIDPGLDAETGIREWQVYRTVDFTPLGFTLTEIGFPLVADSGAFKITGFDATLTVA
jgi:hypothetical protein